MSITLVNDVKAIAKLIKAVHTTSTKFAEQLHQAGYNCVMHAINTGDTRPLQHLYDGLTNAARLALRLWVVKFAPINFSVKDEKFSVKKDRSHDSALLVSIGPMEYKKEIKPKQAKTFDLAKEIERLITRANKHNANGTAVSLLQKAKLSA